MKERLQMIGRRIRVRGNREIYKRNLEVLEHKERE